MKTGVGEPSSPGTKATHLFDALTLKPCDLELARALHRAGHARYEMGDAVETNDLVAGLERMGGDMRIQPIGGRLTGNFVVSLLRRSHRILELASIDIYRIAGGTIAEHWQVVQPAGAILAKTVAPGRRSATRDVIKADPRQGKKYPGTRT